MAEIDRNKCICCILQIVSQWDSHEIDNFVSKLLQHYKLVDYNYAYSAKRGTFCKGLNLSFFFNPI